MYHVIKKFICDGRSFEQGAVFTGDEVTPSRLRTLLHARLIAPSVTKPRKKKVQA